MKAVQLLQINIKHIPVTVLDQLLNDIETLGYIDMVDFSYTYIGYNTHHGGSYQRFAISIYTKKMLKDSKIKELLLEYLI